MRYYHRERMKGLLKELSEDVLRDVYDMQSNRYVENSPVYLIAQDIRCILQVRVI